MTDPSPKVDGDPLDGGSSNPTVTPPGAISQPFQAAPVFVNPLQFPAGLQLGLAAQVQVWQGQFPPPEAIERYERVQPGTFDRLISMAERQQQAVIESTDDARALMSRDTQRGHWLGWSVTVCSILAAAVCGYLKHDVVAVALVAIPVMSVAKALIDSSKAKPSVMAAPPSNVSTESSSTPPSL